jgi:hypothetical protein
MEIYGSVLVSTHRGPVSVELVDGPDGRLWLVDSEHGRPLGRVPVEDIGEVFVEGVRCWFAGGPLPAGATGVSLDIDQAETVVGTGAWLATVPETGRERVGRVEFRSSRGELVATQRVVLPVHIDMPSSRLRRQLTRLQRGPVRYGPVR